MEKLSLHVVVDPQIQISKDTQWIRLSIWEVVSYVTYTGSAGGKISEEEFE